MLLRADYTVFPADASPEGLQDTHSSMTSFGEHSSELTYLLPRSLPVLFEGMESVQIATHWCHGRVGGGGGGERLRSLIHGPSHTFRLSQMLLPANAAAARKHAKYYTISATHLFVPVAVETLGLFCDEGLKFISEIGLRLSTVSDDSRESNFLFLRISVLIQPFNEVAFNRTFPDIPDTEG